MRVITTKNSMSLSSNQHFDLFTFKVEDISLLASPHCSRRADWNQNIDGQAQNYLPLSPSISLCLSLVRPILLAQLRVMHEPVN